MSSHRIKGPVCGIDNCRSRSYEEDADGYQYCKNGHRRGNILVTEREEDDFNPHARWQTAKSDDEGAEKTFHYFVGREAFTLYLQCYQLILRYQIWYLIHNKGLPAELESVIFDLWALRVVHLKDQLANDATGDESQSQMFSSGTDEEATESDDNHSRYSVSGKKAKDTPRIIDTLALCYLGALTLRLPITTGDIYEWTTNGGLVYARAKDCLPPAMRERLPPKFLSLSLEPPTILQQKRLQRAILDLVDSYEHHHGMTFPAINHPLLLYRYMRQLAFPLEIYGAVVKLARLLRYDFAYAPIGSQKRLRIDDIPDAQLISLVVVCVKLFYPFDNIERHPHAPGEPAGSKMDWEAWNKSAATFKRSIAVPAQLMTQELMVLQEKDIFSLKESEIDQYLDWYQQNWADETIREQDKGSNFREELFKQFPVDPLNETMGSRTPNMDDSAVHTALTKRVEDVHKAMSADKAVGGENAINDIKRPGSQYKHYRRERELPEQARSFYEEAAKASGLSLKMLVEAVFFTEQKIRGWGELQRRRQRMQTEE